jgi:hypothetical protein
MIDSEILAMHLKIINFMVWRMGGVQKEVVTKYPNGTCRMFSVWALKVILNSVQIPEKMKPKTNSTWRGPARRYHVGSGIYDDVSTIQIRVILHSEYLAF